MKVRNIIIAALALFVTLSCFGQSKKYKNIYDITVKDIKGNDVSLADYKGKVLPFANQLTMIHQKTGSGFEKGNAIKWNFGKFLVSKDGQTILCFEPMVSPEMIESAIQEMLK